MIGYAKKYRKIIQGNALNKRKRNWPWDENLTPGVQ